MDFTTQETEAGRETDAPTKEKTLTVTFGLWKRLNRKDETTFSALHWKPSRQKSLEVRICAVVNTGANRMQAGVFISAQQPLLNVHRTQSTDNLDPSSSNYFITSSSPPWPAKPLCNHQKNPRFGTSEAKLWERTTHLTYLLIYKPHFSASSFLECKLFGCGP